MNIPKVVIDNVTDYNKMGFDGIKKHPQYEFQN
jgi:hypothetical protein